ncbi:MAG: carbamoyl phosphate synthase large subunit, partial [Pseudomonadota bacterium]
TDFTLIDPMIDHFAVKEAVLPFARFPGVDTILGPEMRSTGEVMGSDPTFAGAFLKAQMGAGTELPKDGAGKVFISIRNEDKTDVMMQAVQTVAGLGHKLLATRGTAKWLKAAGLEVEVVNKVYEGRPDVTDQLKDGLISLVFNTTEGAQAVEDSKSIRSIALYDKIPYYTTAAGSQAAAQAMQARVQEDVGVMALQG